jgi:tetratricopeptide (TPR) repeat protein
MFPEKFKELEEKIRLTTELVSRLRHEKQQLEHDKTQLEQKQQEAAQRITELEDELKRVRAAPPPNAAAVETLLQQLSAKQNDVPSQDQTLHRLSDVLGKEPNNIKALFELGNIYERQGMYEQAILEYRKVLHINPDFVDAIEHLAFLLEKLNRDSEASPLWERILSLKKHV